MAVINIFFLTGAFGAAVDAAVAAAPPEIPSAALTSSSSAHASPTFAESTTRLALMVYSTLLTLPSLILRGKSQSTHYYFPPPTAAERTKQTGSQQSNRRSQ